MKNYHSSVIFISILISKIILNRPGYFCVVKNSKSLSPNIKTAFKFGCKISIFTNTLPTLALILPIINQDAVFSPFFNISQRIILAKKGFVHFWLFYLFLNFLTNQCFKCRQFNDQSCIQTTIKNILFIQFINPKKTIKKIFFIKVFF